MRKPKIRLVEPLSDTEQRNFDQDERYFNIMKN